MAPHACIILALLALQASGQVDALGGRRKLQACSVTTSGGACGLNNGAACCPAGQCCSQWGWCGVTNNHCGTGCQAAYSNSKCTGTPTSSPVTSPRPSPTRSPVPSPKPSPHPSPSPVPSPKPSPRPSPSPVRSPKPSPLPPPASSPKPPTCTSTSTSGGVCGNGACCPSSQCCSQYGFCGVTTAHCGTGCQLAFGTCTGVSPAPTPSPAPIPSPSPGASPPPGTTVRGYYHQTWLPARSAPAGTNLAVAFGGWASAIMALQDAAATFSKLVGEKYLDIGGGNANGRWSLAVVNELNSQLANIKAAGYAGVCYDIEEGTSSLAAPLAASFAAAKAAGLKVLVTVSHSSPYGFPDADAIMDAIVASAHVDYLSPQLYTTGTEAANDYVGDWTKFRSARARVVASIVSPGLYADAQAWFKQQQGITLAGYIVWA